MLAVRRPEILRRAFIIAMLLIPILAGLRVMFVDWKYNNQPIEESFFSDGGYVQPGTYGHGNLAVEDSEVSWIIYDILTANGKIRKSCTKGVLPDPNVDVDFVYHNGLWYKLRSGTGILRADRFTSDPVSHKWGGWLSTRVAFPVVQPDFAYQVKIIRDKFLGRGTSPRQYLQYLKKANPSCFEMPDP